MPPLPPITPQPVPVQLSLEETAALFGGQLWEKLHENAMPILYASLAVILLVRLLAPARFQVLSSYFHMLLFVPLCLILEMTVIPVLLFIRYRIRDDKDSHTPDPYRRQKPHLASAQVREEEEKQN